jgi:hypothetical protein
MKLEIDFRNMNLEGNRISVALSMGSLKYAVIRPSKNALPTVRQVNIIKTVEHSKCIKYV